MVILHFHERSGLRHHQEQKTELRVFTSIIGETTFQKSMEEPGSQPADCRDKF